MIVCQWPALLPAFMYTYKIYKPRYTKTFIYEKMQLIKKIIDLTLQNIFLWFYYPGNNNFFFFYFRHMHNPVEILVKQIVKYSF